MIGIDRDHAVPFSGIRAETPPVARSLRGPNSRPAEHDGDANGAGTAIETRTLALVGLALLIAPFALYAGADFFIPLLVSLFLSYALSPVVSRLERFRVPRGLGAAITLALVIAATASGVQLALSGAADVLEELPRAVQKLRYAVYSWQRDGEGPLKQVRKTADELQKLAGATSSAATGVAAPASPPAPPATEFKALFGAGTAGMVMFIGQLASVVFLTYFLLAAGDLFRRRLMQAAGPSVAARRKTLQILQQIHAVSQRYFALVLGLNIVAGAFTAIGLYLLGIDHALFWGIAMAVLHTIPYVGAAVVSGAVGLSAYVQADSAGLALAAAAVPVATALVIGMWLQTALLGRTGRMNAAVVFVALLFWGTVWGAWGLLLAFPIMAAIKIVCGEVERLKPLAVFMSD